MTAFPELTEAKMRELRVEFDRDFDVRTDGQMHNLAVPLDAMTMNELAVASLHPALHIDVKVIAATLAGARAMRLDGNIVLAQKLEARADRLYAVLPKRLRW